VLSDLRKRGLCVGLKGDPLKENVRVAIEAAYGIINLGVKRWKSG
jgi:hypothetical protein